MRKLLSMSALLLICVMPSAAQTDDGELSLGDQIINIKKNALFVGPKIGIDFTSMTQPNEVDLYDKSGTGFSGGVAIKARFGRATENALGGTGTWGFGLEFKYKQNKVKTIGSDDLSISYFEVPILLQVYPFSKSKSMNTFYCEVGPDIAGTMSKSPDILYVNDNLSYSTGDIKGFDVRMMLGLGYTIPQTGLDLNARYYIGTSDLAGNFPCKMNTLEVSLAWMFSIGKF